MVVKYAPASTPRSSYRVKLHYNVNLETSYVEKKEKKKKGRRRRTEEKIYPNIEKVLKARRMTQARTHAPGKNVTLAACLPAKRNSTTRDMLQKKNVDSW